jgi:hypothetical protein
MEPFVASWVEVVEANPLKDMVGPWGLEPQTSTVSKSQAWSRAERAVPSLRMDDLAKVPLGNGPNRRSWRIQAPSGGTDLGSGIKIVAALIGFCH